MNVKRFLALVLIVSGLHMPSSTAQGAWYAEYFANPDLSGGPVLTRYDDRLDFNWGAGSPDPALPADGFSVRWTRDEWFEAGTWRFSYRADDGLRVWVDGVLVVDAWHANAGGWATSDYFIPRGVHPVRVEFYEGGGNALVQLEWERLSGGATWRGEYFANRDLSGSPTLVRDDPAVDFDWGTGSPDPALPADDFSVRWSRRLGFTAGTYRFHTSTDDGVRLYVDGQLIIEAWQDASLPNVRSADLYLSDGMHDILVEYYEHGGGASAHVWWVRQGDYAGWEGRYYDNADLRGGPALVRDDAEINFDWGEGAPADWMPSDAFSAQWTRQVNFAPGYYRLNVRADDGVRVWLDDALVMDYWHPQEGQWRYLDGVYLSGLHTLRVEYFERTGSAYIRFWWEPSPAATAPPPTPVPAVTPTPPGPWTAEYYDNANLSGEPALTRTDTHLQFDWGWDAPAPAVGADWFSVRWRGTFWFEGGRYTFETFSDDGVRVYVDQQLVINSWRPMRGRRSGTVDLGAGQHTVRVEYFERMGRASVQLTWRRSGPAVAPEQPTSCTGGPLWFDAWPVAAVCADGGWYATIFVQGHGGSCRYTYGWEGEVQGGPTAGAVTFNVYSADRNTAIVGRVFVTSGGQTRSRGLFVRHPTCP